MDLKTLISKTPIDPQLSRVKSSMRRENRENAPDSVRPVFSKLSVCWGLVFVDNQIVVLIDLRQRLLESLHFGHSGMNKMETAQNYSGGRRKRMTLKRKSRVARQDSLQVKFKLKN